VKTASKFFGIIAFAAIIGFLSAGCASQPAESPGGMTLDQAIAEAAVRIDERIEAGSKIALLNFSSPSDRFSLYVLDELSANLLDSRKLTVVDRREVDLIRGEFDFQFSGEVSDDSIQRAGQILGAQSIVSGSLTEIGGEYRIAIRVLNVQTAAIEVHFRSDIANDRRVQALLEEGRATAAGGVPHRLITAQTPQTPVTQAPATQAPADQMTVPQPAPSPAALSAPPPPPPPPPPRLENGRRTFHPRPQAYQGARAVNAFVYYIVVRNEYMTIQIRSSPTHGGYGTRVSGFRNWQQVTLLDLDRPNRSLVPVQGGGNWGSWLTFRNADTTRFRLSCTANTPRIVFDEIRLGAPD